MLGDEGRSWRADALNKRFVIGKTKFEVDTCYTPDTDQWETGIKRNNGNWIIVEMYGDKEKAEKGHKEWIKKLKKNPKTKLKNCISPNDWFFGDY